MGLQAFVRFLVPRENHFYTFLERQAGVAHDGAVVMATFSTGNAVAVRDAMQDLEHEGDKIVHEMEEALARTFVTPIDREDLHSLSIEIDDILDHTNGAARACVLFGVEEPNEAMTKLFGVLVRCTEVLENAMPMLRKHEYADLIETARRVHALEKEGDQIYRSAISALFHDASIDAKELLRVKGVLEDLENAIDQCEHVADRLSNLGVKHG